MTEGTALLLDNLRNGGGRGGIALFSAETSRMSERGWRVGKNSLGCCRALCTDWFERLVVGLEYLENT